MDNALEYLERFSVAMGISTEELKEVLNRLSNSGFSAAKAGESLRKALEKLEDKENDN